MSVASVRDDGIRNAGRIGYQPLHWTHVREYEAGVGGSAWAGFSDARLALMPMVGYALRGGVEAEIVALGGVFWVNGRRAEGMFAMRPEFASEVQRSAWVHRAAIEVLGLAHRVAPVIYARADEAIPRSRKWLMRLGFAPPKSGEWWTHDMGSGSGQIGRIVSDQQLAERGDARRDRG